MIKKFLRKNDGLTLVELMVSIAIGTMIFAAATTVLLLGFRIHAKTTDSIEQQYTARMVVTMLEEMASDGDMGKIKRDLDGSWWVYDDQQHEVIFYSAGNQAIYVGSQPEPVLKNIVASYLILDEKKVLTISLEDPDRTYSSSIFCRTVLNEEGEKFEDSPVDHLGSTSGDDAVAKQEFLGILLSQVGTKGGIIDHSKEPGNYTENEKGEVIEINIECDCKTFNFFSEWYLGGYTATTEANGWGPETPWCACFVSWGLVNAGLSKETQNQNSNDANWYANVDAFMKYFRTRAVEKNCWKSAKSSPAPVPVPGDLIFFDMIKGSNDDPSHMGVVLSVEILKDENESPILDEQGNQITIVKTIEGNSADVVAIREYAIDDDRILGYGDPWAAQAKSE